MVVLTLDDTVGSEYELVPALSSLTQLESRIAAEYRSAHLCIPDLEPGIRIEYVITLPVTEAPAARPEMGSR